MSALYGMRYSVKSYTHCHRNEQYCSSS